MRNRAWPSATVGGRIAVIRMPCSRSAWLSRNASAAVPVISGCIGPRGDGYVVSDAMSVDEATRYHSQQINILADSGIDCVSAFTLNFVAEAAGVALAARAAGVPSVISFTVETDGELVTGETLADAMGQVEDLTSDAPAYYMINCAHPDHFSDVLVDGQWIQRLRGVVANASRCSHARRL